MCPETSAGGVRQAEWPGRGGQLREVGVLRPGIGGDQGVWACRPAPGMGVGGVLGGFVAGGEDTNHYALVRACLNVMKQPSIV